MRECFEIDFEESEPFEIPALVLAALAWPGPNDGGARMSLCSSLCVKLIQERCTLDPDWALEPLLIKPVFLTWPPSQVEKDMRTFYRRMRDRLTAGHLAVAFLQQAESGVLPKLPQGALRLSLNEMTKTVTEDLGIENPENVETRVWRQSLPVIHLCAAWAVCLRQAEAATGRLPTILDLYTDPDFLRLVLGRAELNVPLLAKSRLNIAPERLIRFRPMEVGSKIGGFGEADRGAKKTDS